MTPKPNPKIVEFINSLKAIDSIGSSDTSKSVIVDLYDFRESTLLCLYGSNENHKIKSLEDCSRQYGLHELTDELFRSEFFLRLRQANISSSILDMGFPGVSAFEINAPYTTVEHIISEIDLNYFNSLY